MQVLVLPPLQPERTELQHGQASAASGHQLAVVEGKVLQHEVRGDGHHAEAIGHRATWVESCCACCCLRLVRICSLSIYICLSVFSWLPFPGLPFALSLLVQLSRRYRYAKVLNLCPPVSYLVGVIIDWGGIASFPTTLFIAYLLGSHFRFPVVLHLPVQLHVALVC